jgi:hypothetical protein
VGECEGKRGGGKGLRGVWKEEDGTSAGDVKWKYECKGTKFGVRV